MRKKNNKIMKKMEETLFLNWCQADEEKLASDPIIKTYFF